MQMSITRLRLTFYALVVALFVGGKSGFRQRDSEAPERTPYMNNNQMTLQVIAHPPGATGAPMTRWRRG